MSEWENRSAFRKIILLNLVATAFFSLLGPMATKLTDVFNVGLADIGFINAIFLIISGGVSFIWALFADKTGRKKLLLLCSIIWASCSFLMIFSINYSMLLILHIIASIGFGGILPISFTLIVDLTIPEKRAYALGILQTCASLGAGLGLILGGVLIEFLPWWTPFLIISLLAFINICFITTIKEPERGSLDELFEASEVASELAFKISKKDFKEAIKIKSNSLLILYTIVKSLSIGALNFYFISMLIIDHGFTSSSATILMIGIFSVQLFGAPFFGKMADKQYEKRKTGKADILLLILVIGPIFYILGLTLVFQVSDISLIVLFIIFVGIAAFVMAADFAITQSIISDVDSPQIRTTVFSLIYISSAIGQSLGVLLCGYYYGLYNNSFRIAFLITGLILLSSIVFIIPLRKTIVSDLRYLEEKYGKKEN